MSPSAKRRLAAVFALSLAGAALGFIAYGGIEKNLVYYWNVDQLLERGDTALGATVRLGGVVQAGTHSFDPASLALRFRVGMAADPQSKGVAVAAHGAPPQMFREGIGVVLEGHYDGTAFLADRVMVKHSNEYRAPAPGEDPAQLYKTLSDETASR